MINRQHLGPPREAGSISDRDFFLANSRREYRLRLAAQDEAARFEQHCGPVPHDWFVYTATKQFIPGIRVRKYFVGLLKEQAQAVYRICQAQDQAWREKRRVRELEELRARSGGIQVSSGPAPLATGTGGVPDAVRRLQEAKQMLDARLITDAEYEAIKAKIVAS